MLIRTEVDNDGHVQFRVRDTGVGFRVGEAGRVFEPFYSTKTDGMGIGLSISRSIVECHRGRLWATSNDDAGATFAFSIPALGGDTGSSVGSDCLDKASPTVARAQ